MMKRKVNVFFKCLNLFLLVPITISFWFFSRLTIDDAFISWRYGKNIVDFGIWNYNPSVFDMTQAYTNPMYAFLSIVPNYFQIDVVLFFKIISVLTIVLFILWLNRKVKRNLFMLLLYFALPATFIHAFSGLETFMYVVLLAALLIYLYENNFYSSLLCTVILFFLRPETWVLLLLVPLYFLIHINTGEENTERYIFSLKTVKIDWRRALLGFLLLSIPLGLYLIFSKLYFGYFLPNTFYIKSSGNFKFTAIGLFSITIKALKFSFFTIPLFLIFIPYRDSYRNILTKIWFVLIVLTFFVSSIVVYSVSSLQMDYINRFAFHIFTPIYFFIVYFAGEMDGNYYYISLASNFIKHKKIQVKLIANGVLLLFLFVFLYRTMNPSDLAHMANYYPRALDSHAKLGKVLNEMSMSDGITSFSFGDAGMTAYHSGIIALDNIGLGSSMVAHTGVTEDVINAFNPDIIVFHSQLSGIRYENHNQKQLYDWAIKNSYKEIGELFWTPTYLLKIYGNEDYEEITNICNISKSQNDMLNSAYFLKTVANPPWSYWKE